MSKLLSHKIAYGATHWARSVNPNFFIKRFDSDYLNNGTYMVLYSNPSDRNGYRSILKLFNDDQNELEKLWNRPISHNEYCALFSVTPGICDAYRKLNLFPQVFMLGNNSHQFIENNMVLGTDNEPAFAHLHFYARGNPDHCYIEDIPLCGNKPGDDVNMRVKTVPTISEALKMKNYFLSALL